MTGPILRFKDGQSQVFPQWKEKTLGSLGSFYNGLSGKNKSDFEQGDCEFIPYMNVYKNSFAKLNQLGKVSIRDNEKQNVVKYGDLLFTQSSETVEEVGLSSVWTGKATPYLNSFCFGFRLNNFMITNPIFLGHLMRTYSVRKQIMLEGQGISRINISSNRLKKIKLSLPSLQEQCKIADFLSCYDALIDYQSQRLETLQKRKLGLLQRVFSRELRFRDDQGNEFPDWEEELLNELVDIHARIGWQNLRKSEFLTKGNYYLITGTDFNAGKINFDSCYYVEKERYEQDPHIKVVEDNILITKDGTIGKVAYVGKMDKPGTLNAGVFCLKKKSQNISMKYLFQYLNRPFLLKYAKKHSTGGTIQHLNQSVLVKVPVPCPNIEEQKKIADFLGAVDAQIEVEENRLESMKTIKKGLLQQMFI